MSATAEPQGFTGGHNPWAVALTVTLATFMEVLDTSIANVSLPHIAGNLSVSQDESTWVLTSYLVSNAVVLPVSGWLASRFGRKRFYMSCVVVFTASSFLCGVAPSLGALVFFRVLQGLGGGGLGPSEQAILADTFPPSRRGMAFAVYGMAVVLAPAIGPTLGGWITDHFSWRWVFFINVPVGIASLLLSSRMVVDPPWIAEGRSRAGSIDYVGLGLVAVGLGALEYVLDKGQEDDWFASGALARLPVDRARLPLHPHQHPRVRRRPAREEQRRLRHHQPLAQPGRAASASRSSPPPSRAGRSGTRRAWPSTSTPGAPPSRRGSGPWRRRSSARAAPRWKPPAARTARSTAR